MPPPSQARNSPIGRGAFSASFADSGADTRPYCAAGFIHPRNRGETTPSVHVNPPTKYVVLAAAPKPLRVVGLEVGVVGGVEALTMA